MPAAHVLKLHNLLKYRLPPGRALDVGCSHAAFVALMKAAGFDAVGLELSPWVCDFARRNFGVPMLVGALEEQQLEPKSFAAIVLNDLIEHVPDPEDTIRRCAELLTDDGVLVIQPPRYPEEAYESLTGRNAPFLEMMSPALSREHLHLFSDRSMASLLERCGLKHSVRLTPAFVYDMYVVASRSPLRESSPEEIGSALRRSPEGRLAEAWLANWQRAVAFEEKFERSKDHYEELRRVAHAELERLNAEAGRWQGEYSKLNQVAHGELSRQSDQVAGLLKELGRLRDLANDTMTERDQLREKLDSLRPKRLAKAAVKRVPLVAPVFRLLRRLASPR